MPKRSNAGVYMHFTFKNHLCDVINQEMSRGTQESLRLIKEVRQFIELISFDPGSSSVDGE